MSGSPKPLKRRRHVEYGRWGYIFIAPFFIVYALFSLYPLLYTFWLSFQEFYMRLRNAVGPKLAECFGFQNFADILTDFSKSGAIMSLGNTAILWIVNFVPQIILSMLLAVWLTDTKLKLKGQGAFKIMIYMPNIITAASISVLFYSLFANGGPFAEFLRDVGIISENFNFMESVWGTRGIISFINFWMWYGNTMLLLIAGILGISPSLFEAASIDGAGGLKTFTKITLPCLKPIVLYVFVTSAIGGLQMFDIPALYNVTENAGDALPDYASQTVAMYIKSMGFGQSPNYGRAAAASLILFVVTLAISLIFFFTLGDSEKRQEKKRKKRELKRNLEALKGGTN